MADQGPRHEEEPPAYGKRSRCKAGGGTCPCRRFSADEARGLAGGRRHPRSCAGRRCPRRQGFTILWHNRRGRRNGRVWRSMGGWSGCGRARCAASGLRTAPGPLSSPASHAKQPAGWANLGRTISRSRPLASRAAAACCRPRHSMLGRPGGRGAQCPVVHGMGRLGPKERLACERSSAESAATADGARYRLRPKPRQPPRRSSRPRTWRRPLLQECPPLTCSLSAIRLARRRCQQCRR